MGIVSIAVLALDQATKTWARASLLPGKEVTIAPGWVWFALRHNTGATLGLLSGHSALIATLSVFIVAALVLVALRAEAGGTAGALALGAVVGGALGNLVDRLRLGAVTDFIEIHLWPTDFNLADAAIRLGVVLFLLILVVEFFRGRRRPASSRNPV